MSDLKGRGFSQPNFFHWFDHLLYSDIDSPLDGVASKLLDRKKAMDVLYLTKPVGELIRFQLGRFLPRLFYIHESKVSFVVYNTLYPEEQRSIKSFEKKTYYSDIDPLRGLFESKNKLIETYIEGYI